MNTSSDLQNRDLLLKRPAAKGQKEEVEAILQLLNRDKGQAAAGLAAVATLWWTGATVAALEQNKRLRATPGDYLVRARALIKQAHEILEKENK